MGREIKRVPLEFDWPLNKVWQGYLMPDFLREQECLDCDGCGVTTAHRWVTALAHMLLMLDDDLDAQARGRAMHPYFRDCYTTAYGTRPSADIREFGTGLAGREGSPFGHDAIDGWRATHKIIAAAGLDPETWGRCRSCAGRGSTEKYPGQRADAEAWERTEPPTGDGWQLWETVSEGSPLSPVFSLPNALAAWMESPDYRDVVTYEAALNFVREGWAPSFVSTPETGVISGVEFVGKASQ